MYVGLALAVFVASTAVVVAEPAASRPMLRIAFGDATPPLYWKTGSSTGDVEGLLVDLMREVAALTDSGFEASTFPLPRVQHMVEAGEVDGMVNVVTQPRLAYAVPSAEALLKGRVSIFAHKESPLLERLKAVKTLDELAAASATVISLRGSGWTKTNLESRGIKIIYAPGTVADVKMLIAKRGDAIVDMSVTINWILKDVTGHESIVELPTPIEVVGWHLMISKRSPFAKRMDAVDKAIASLKASAKFRELFAQHGVTE